MHNLLTVKETAKYLRIPLPTVYYLVQRGQLPAIQIGGRWRIKKNALDKDILKEDKSGQPTVLVVDDDEIIRQHLSKVLALRGIACDCAVDGEDALHKIAGHHYDLVIADLRMPELDGHSLALVLLHQLKPPRIIALTGMKDPSLAADLLAHGVEEIVYKPVDYFDLADRLKLMFYTDQLNAKPNNGVGENRTGPCSRILRKSALPLT
jgi:excisionase family DNA binding protein